MLLFERNRHICSFKKYFLTIVVGGGGTLVYFELINIITFKFLLVPAILIFQVIFAISFVLFWEFIEFIFAYFKYYNIIIY